MGFALRERGGGEPAARRARRAKPRRQVVAPGAGVPRAARAGADPARARAGVGARPSRPSSSFASRRRTRRAARALAGGRRPRRGPRSRCPAPLEPGVHELRLSLAGPAPPTQLLIVAPAHGVTAPTRRSAARRALGVWTNLYTVRSRANAGFGDFGDLARLADALGELGVDFVALNPLHALLNRGHAITPYSPISRVFGNLLYIDVEAVPELRELRARARASPAQLPLARFRGADALDHAELAAAKLQVLRELHRGALGASCARRAGAQRRAREGRELVRLRDLRGAAGASCASRDWRRWPAELRDPRSDAVREFADAHAEDVDFRCWLQFELDRQLERAAETARGAGLRDRAVQGPRDRQRARLGRHLDVARALRATARRSARRRTPTRPTGQDWGLPPLDSARGCAPTATASSPRCCARPSARAGALRIDHVMGLLRLFWIPAGRPGSEGTYVAQPADELFGVLALESRRGARAGDRRGSRHRAERARAAARVAGACSRRRCSASSATASSSAPSSAYPARALDPGRHPRPAAAGGLARGARPRAARRHRRARRARGPARRAGRARRGPRRARAPAARRGRARRRRRRRPTPTRSTRAAQRFVARTPVAAGGARARRPGRRARAAQSAGRSGRATPELVAPHAPRAREPAR